MAKELYIYGPIWEESSLDFIKGLESAAGEDLSIRVNTPGGQPSYMYGMIAKYQEYKGKKNVKVDYSASSSGLFFIVYADTVEGSSVSEYLLHRAAYPAWYEKDYMTESQKETLVHMNNNLRRGLEARIDVEEFTRITGKTLDDIFSLDSRIDVTLTAKQAKKIGLIDSIFKISPKEKSVLEAKYAYIEARYQAAASSVRNSESEKRESKKSKKMTIEELKADHPELYAQIFAKGQEAGKKEGEKVERDRISEIMAFADLDPELCAKVVAEGRTFTPTEQRELRKKEFAQLNALNLNADDKGEKPGASGNPPGADKNAEAKAKAKELEDFDKILKI